MDVEMGDAEKLHDDSGNNIQEAECKITDPKVGCKEEVPCEAAGSGDVSGRDKGGEYLNKCRGEDKDKMNVKTEVEVQTNPVNEIREPIEGSDSGNIVTKSENEKLIRTEIETEAQTAGTSSVEIQSDRINEVAEPEASNSGVKEGESTKNDVVEGNHGEDVERPNEKVLKKKLNEIGKDTENTEDVVGGRKVESADSGNVPAENMQLPTEFYANIDPREQDAELDHVCPAGKDEEKEDAVRCDQDKMVRDKQGVKTLLVNHETASKPDAVQSSVVNQNEAAASNSLIRCSSAKAVGHSGMPVFSPATLPLMGEDDDGTPEDQAAFMKELERFHRERAMEFKPPKFYGQPLNCLK